MELVLNTYGVALSRDNEGFVIVHNDEKQRIPTVGIKSIQISKGAQITSDAVLLAIENEIEILFMDKSGNPMGRVWSPFLQIYLRKGIHKLSLILPKCNHAMKTRTVYLSFLSLPNYSTQ